MRSAGFRNIMAQNMFIFMNLGSKEVKRIRKFLGKWKYIFEPVLISIVAIFLISIGWAYLIQETNRYTDSAIETYVTGQEMLLRQVAKEIRNDLSSRLNIQNIDYAKAEDETARIVKQAESSGSRYWFFYSSNRVIFEKDLVETRNVKDKKISELINYWKVAGGDNTNQFGDMIINGTSGSVSFTKNGKIGEEVVSIESFTIDNKKYYVGISTIRRYILNIAKVHEHILYLRIFSIIATVNIILFSLLLFIRIFIGHRDSTKLKNDLTMKSIQIRDLTNKLTIKSEAVQNISIYDTLTGLYNKKFFESLLMKIDYKKVKPVSVIIIDINGLEYINSKIGYEAGDKLLKRVSDLLKETCIDSDVIARTGSSEFSIFMASTKGEQAYGIAESINRKFMSSESNELTLAIGVYQMPNEDEKILYTMQNARKNMIFAKMLDKSSSSSSIITMLMETLSAFSREAVQHSERLKVMALSFGKYLGLSPADVNKLAVAAQLHDVGKIGVPDNILNKNGPLDEQEMELVKRHSEIGYNIMKSIPFLDGAAIDVLQHHEHYDGRGYPNGIKGNEIGLNGRIINILDSFDIMTHDRVYADTKTVEEALLDIKEKSGSQYDPYLVEEFRKSINEKFLINKVAGK